MNNFRGKLSNQRLRQSYKNEEEEDETEEEGTLDFNRNVGDGGSDDYNYNDMLERLRIADFLYKEYSLEEVIYQLAKEMFTQSIIRGIRRLVLFFSRQLYCCRFSNEYFYLFCSYER